MIWDSTTVLLSSYFYFPPKSLYRGYRATKCHIEEDGSARVSTITWQSLLPKPKLELGLK